VTKREALIGIALDIAIVGGVALFGFWFLS
jgi:hypothetical protein